MQRGVVQGHVGVGGGGVGEEGGDLDAVDVDVGEGGDEVDAGCASAREELDALSQEEEAAVKVG